MPCSIKGWSDVTPEGAEPVYRRGARESALESEYPVYENTNEMLGSAIRFSFRSAGLGRMRRLLQRQCLPGVRAVLRRCIPRWWSLRWRSLLRAWLSGCGDSRSWRPRLLYSRRGLLRRSHLLCLEAGPLGDIPRPKNVEARSLRRARRILDRRLAFRVVVHEWLRQAPAGETK